MTDIVLDLPLDQPLDELFAIIAKDKDGNEGIMTVNGQPLVFGSMHNLEHSIKRFGEIAKFCGKKIQLCRYKKTEVIREST